MRRALLVILAAAMTVVGCCLLAVSGWVYAAFGSGGGASSSLGTITSAPGSTAVVIDVDATHISIPMLPVHGTTTIHLESADQSPLIAGASDRSAVDALVGARELDAAYRQDGAWTLAHVPGASASEAWPTLPGWMRSGASIDITLEDGQTLAIANADGSAGVEVSTSLRFSAPHAPTAALVLAISGGVLALAGLALAFGAIWLMRRRPDEHAE